MVLGVGFSVLVFCALWLAWQTPSLLLGTLCGACGLGLLGAALAWLGGGPRLFGKRADGRMPWWSYPVHWGWYVLALLAFYGRLAVSRESACDEVAPGVWVGRRLVGAERGRLPDADAAVLDMTAEFPATVWGGAYRCEPVLDGTAPTTAQLSSVSSWIAEQREHGRVVYVHCAMGHGRSATAVAAWMMQQEPGLTVDGAEARMRAHRPGIRLASVQRRALSRGWQT